MRGWRVIATRASVVAVFNSGVGGLTVLHELLVWLPHKDFLYLGDTARFPYGDASRRGARGLLDGRSPSALLARRAKLIVVACNSADGGGAAGAAAAHDGDDAGRRRARRRPPRGRAGRGGDARRGGSGCSPRRRPSAAARTPRRSRASTRTSSLDVRRLPRARAGHPGRVPVRRGARRRRCAATAARSVRRTSTR